MREHLSVQKRARQNEKARQRNRMWKSKIKTMKNRLEQLIEAKDVDSLKELYNSYISIVDKASSKGIIHKSSASRKKMQMAQKINSLTSAS